MKIKLTAENKKELESRHRVERDGRVRDRIKAVLLKSEGWTNVMIGLALQIHVDTVEQHLQDWQQEQKLKPENGGSQSKLNAQQNQQLAQHIQATLYTKAYAICAYVAKTYRFWHDKMVKRTGLSLQTTQNDTCQSGCRATRGVH